MWMCFIVTISYYSSQSLYINVTMFQLIYYPFSLLKRYLHLNTLPTNVIDLFTHIKRHFYRRIWACSFSCWKINKMWVLISFYVYMCMLEIITPSLNWSLQHIALYSLCNPRLICLTTINKWNSHNGEQTIGVKNTKNKSILDYDFDPPNRQRIGCRCSPSPGITTAWWHVGYTCWKMSPCVKVHQASFGFDLLWTSQRHCLVLNRGESAPQ
jgi:hypothetical protein